jgi:hypothetical protein
LNGESRSAPAVLVDAHVHLHDCFEPAVFLDHAWRNFEQAARRVGTEDVLGVLMFTESAGMDWFGRLAGARVGAWMVGATADPAALSATRDRQRLIVVAGRQIVAREGLEVHLLGTRATMPDGLAIRDILEEGRRLGALRVIPWGVGKWLFQRGQLLSKLIADAQPGQGFFLGDGSGRPFFWTRPRHFEEAERRGLRILAGTDPLPIPEEVSRSGSYGFRLGRSLDLDSPAEGLKAALLDPTTDIRRYGRLERLVPFVRHQLAMQSRKRGRTQTAGRSEIA